ncbi:hypothetical protein [Hydrogenophaga sp.]|uniref:hypothetical protein n=1 Tax=Hydrogenophaga sp. TaxID=1904254 RepID=UPI003F717B8D
MPVDVDRSAHHPRPATLTPDALQRRHDAILFAINHLPAGGEDRLNVFRTVISSELRDAIGQSNPEMAAAVTQATQELGLEPAELAKWMHQMLTPKTLEWTADFGDARSIGSLALSIAISTLPQPQRAALLGKLLNPGGPACAAVAKSLDAEAISATAYAMANCLPERPRKWLETVQNVVLADDCVDAVATSGDHAFLGSTALAAAMLPDKDRRTQVLGRLLTEDNQSILRREAFSHPTSLAFAVFAAQHLPAGECVSALQGLISRDAISAVLHKGDGSLIATLARGAWHLPSDQRGPALLKLVTPDTCQLVLDLNDERTIEVMCDAAQGLPHGSQRQAVQEKLGLDEEIPVMSLEKLKSIEQWADVGVEEVRSSGPLADPQQALSQAIESQDVKAIVDELGSVVRATSTSDEQKRAMLRVLLDPEWGACKAVADSLDPAAIATAACTMSRYLQSDLAQAESELSKAFQSLFSEECLKAVTSGRGLGIGPMATSATSLPVESQRTEALRKLLADEQCLVLQKQALTHPDLLAVAVSAAFQLPRHEGDKVLERLVTPGTCRAVAGMNHEAFLEIMREGAGRLAHLPQNDERQVALRPVQPWEKLGGQAPDRRSVSARSPSLGGP